MTTPVNPEPNSVRRGAGARRGQSRAGAWLAASGSATIGAASGLGRGFALALARGGAPVAVVDLNETGARDTVDAIGKGGGQGLAYRADVSDKPRIGAVVAEIADRWRGPSFAPGRCSTS